jgi:hypothetical protein
MKVGYRLNSTATFNKIVRQANFAPNYAAIGLGGLGAIGGGLAGARRDPETGERNLLKAAGGALAGGALGAGAGIGGKMGFKALQKRKLARPGMQGPVQNYGSYQQSLPGGNAYN